MDKKINRMDVVDLIQFVRDHPILYDSTLPESKDYVQKDTVWKECAETFQQSVDEIRKKWKNLRDMYARHLKCKSVSGLFKTKKNGTYWQWATHMEFLKPFIKSIGAGNANNLNAVENVVKDDMRDSSYSGTSIKIEYEALNESNPEQALVGDPLTGSQFLVEPDQVSLEAEEMSMEPPVKRKKGPEKLNSSATGVDKVIEYLQNKQKRKEYSAIELLFLSYAKTVENFPPERQVRTKLKIAQIIMEAELEQCKQQSDSQDSLSD